MRVADSNADVSDTLADTSTCTFLLHIRKSSGCTHWLHFYNVMNRMKRSSTKISHCMGLACRNDF